MKKPFLLALAAALSLTGCLGYHIGPVKPHVLRDIHSISVPTFKNRTLRPRVEVLVTGTVIKQFQQDGTYRIANSEDADATLQGEIVGFGRAPSRSVRGNVLSTSEFVLSVRVHYTLVGRDGKPVSGPSDVTGSSSYFVGGDIITDERQALPLAVEDLATRLVGALSEGW